MNEKARGASHAVADFVCRFAGFSIEDVDALGAGGVESELRQSAELAEILHDLRQRVSEELYTHIGGCGDRATRQIVIEARRALFTGTRLRDRQSIAIEKILPATANAMIRDLQRREDQYICSIQELHEHAVECVARGRHAFATYLQDDDFQRALFLSSAPLFSNRHRYVRALDAGFKSRDEQIERGLLKYFLRAAMKSTPFGTFCGVAPGRFGEVTERSGQAHHALSIEADPTRKFSRVRVSKRLFAFLWQGVQRHPTLSLRIPIELNPTAQAHDAQVRFLSPVRGAEVFQRIRQTVPLTTVMNAMNARGTAHITVEDIVGSLLSDPQIDTDEIGASEFLRSLTEIGLLRFVCPVPEHEAEWIGPFAESLDTSNTSEGVQLATHLRAVDQYAAEFARQGPADRPQSYSNLAKHVNLALEIFSIAVGDTLEPLVYEDARAQLIVSGQAERLGVPISEFASYAAATRVLRKTRDQMAAARRVFDDLYAPDARVPILRFYEDFFRCHQKENLERIAAHRAGQPVAPGYDLANPLQLAPVSARQRAYRDLESLVLQKWRREPTACEIAITPQEVDEICSPLRPGESARTRVSAFCQVHDDGDSIGARLIVPGGTYAGGFGRFFSRFLYLFDAQFTESLRAANRRDYGGTLAEVSGDAHFNANLHAELVETQLRYPTGDRPRCKNVVDFQDIVVEQVPRDLESLRLAHAKTGSTILPLDIGFLNLQYRPTLYRLLAMFSPTAWFSFPLPNTINGDSKGADSQRARADASVHKAPAPSLTSYRPRIVYGSSIVIARRRWTADIATVPKIRRDRGLGFALRELDIWRTTLGIGSEAYFHFTAISVPKGEKPELGDAEFQPEGSGDIAIAPDRTAVPKKAYRRDWHKPQYINFGNPLLASTFMKQAEALPSGLLVFEEMLPGRNGVTSFAGRHYVTELTLELDVG